MSPFAPPHFGALEKSLRLRVERLCVDRGGRHVLENVGFSLNGGEAMIVTGPNGAGKSTLLRAIAGLLPYIGGDILFEGAQAGVDLAQQTHYLAHADGMKSALTVEENLDFWTGFLSGVQDPRSITIPEALELVGLSHAAHAPFGVLSAGQKRRAALGRLLVAFRPLWLLDEPLTAVDHGARERFARVMSEHCARGGLIIATTHEPLGLAKVAELALGAAR